MLYSKSKIAFDFGKMHGKIMCSNSHSGLNNLFCSSCHISGCVTNDEHMLWNSYSYIRNVCYVANDGSIVE